MHLLSLCCLGPSWNIKQRQGRTRSAPRASSAWRLVASHEIAITWYVTLSAYDSVWCCTSSCDFCVHTWWWAVPSHPILCPDPGSSVLCPVSCSDPVSRPVLSCRITSCPILSCPILAHRIASHHITAQHICYIRDPTLQTHDALHARAAPRRPRSCAALGCDWVCCCMLCCCQIFGTSFVKLIWYMLLLSWRVKVLHVCSNDWVARPHMHSYGIALETGQVKEDGHAMSWPLYV